MSESCRIDDTEYKTWSFNATKVLIDYYKQYRNKVGSFDIRNMKKLWEIIATKISKEMKMNVTAANCENRWRVIERNYKKYVDNNNKTGRGRKDFEYSKEMDEIFGKKRNVNPEILLSAATCCEPLLSNLQEENFTPAPDTFLQEENNKSNVEKPTNEKKNDSDLSQSIVTPLKNHRSKYSTPKSRGNMADNRLAHEKEQFAFKKSIAERKLLLEEKKLQEKIRKNNLIEERNKILKEYLEKGLSLPNHF